MAERSKMSTYRHARWSRQEDKMLLNLVNTHGPLHWNFISQLIVTRTPKQCRQRYYNYLDPTLNLEPITAEEGRVIERFVAEHGKRWAEIARLLHNRTDNAVKNWWNVSRNRRKREALKAELCSCHKHGHHSGDQHYGSPHTSKSCHAMDNGSRYHEPHPTVEISPTYSDKAAAQRASYSYQAQMYQMPEKLDTDFRYRSGKSSFSASSFSSSTSYPLSASDKSSVLTPSESSYSTDSGSTCGNRNWPERLPPLSTGGYHVVKASHDNFRDPFSQPILRSQVHEIHPQPSSPFSVTPSHERTQSGGMQINVVQLPSPQVSNASCDTREQSVPYSSKDDRMNINSLLQ